MPALAPLMPATHPAAPKPLYAQVRDLLMARIRAAEWGAGETLPNEYVLSTEFDVSIGTVRRAVAELETNGVLIRKQGRGTFVAGRGTGAFQDRFCALRTPLGEKLVPAFELISLTRRPAIEAERARMPAAAVHGIFEVVQRVDSGGRPIGVEISALPAGLLPRLDTQLRFGQDLYSVLADYGFLVTRIEDSIGIEPPPPAIGQQLGCGPDQSLLVVARRAFALDGQAIELRTAHYLPDQVRYAGAS